ncbi:MAG: ATP synthase subunit I [Thermodesulfobacteriota bacterium]
MVVQQRLLKFIMWTNWILFAAASTAGIIIASPETASGIIAGGLIAVMNFQMLYRTLKGALTPPHLASPNAVLVKYYIRFIISGVILFLLIAAEVVHPLGLFIGLSVVVASIILGTIREFTKLISKEAV